MIEYTIPQNLVERAYYADWHKYGRGDMYSRTDRDKPVKTDRKVLMGNIGEVAAYGAYCGVYGVPCFFPNFKKVDKPGKHIWPDDLILMDTWKYGRRKLLINQAVKGQFYTEAKKYKPSWVFQLNSRGRKGDPLLEDPNMPCLFIGVFIDDADFNIFPNCSIKCKIYSFFWPQISKFISEPSVTSNKGYKKAIYLRDIKHLEINHDTLQRQ